ncbi:hypothetical protein ES703_77983 [subsurface metagenome]
MLQPGRLQTKEVRARVGITRWQISRYRKAGLFPYDPIAVSYAGLGSNRLYMMEAETTLGILEVLRGQGFSMRAIKVLFHTMNITGELKGFISFDDRARMVIDPERLELAKQIIEQTIENLADEDRQKIAAGKAWGEG